MRPMELLGVRVGPESILLPTLQLRVASWIVDFMFNQANLINHAALQRTKWAEVNKAQSIW